MSDKTKKLTSFSDTDCRYVAYKAPYNDDLCNIVDQHKNKTIAENLVFETAKNIVDELESFVQQLSDLKRKVKGLKEQPLKDQKEGAERLSIRMNKEATAKLESLNSVLQLIEEIQ